MVKFLQDNPELDDKMLGFLNHWKTKGDVAPYLKAITTDFTKMSPEDVMRYSLRERNPEMSAEDFEILAQIKIIDRYKLDSEKFSEAEIKSGRIELMADSREFREKLTNDQKEFILSSAPAQEPPDTSEQDYVSQHTEAYKKQLNESPYTKAIVANNQIILGEGPEAFKYNVNPKELTSILENPDDWAKAIFASVPDKDGNGEFVPDVEKQMLVATVVKYGKHFFEALATHYKSLGADKAIAPIENAKGPDGSASKGTTTPDTPAAAMAKGGRLVTSIGY